MRSTLAALAAAALLAGPPAWAAAPGGPRATAPGAAPRAKKPSRAAHPDVRAAPAADCASCHAAATPAAYEAWRASKHGLALVKCLACHGSTGEDFVRRPPPGRCLGCHGEQVASLGASGLTKGKDCFSCHAAHALTPHAVRADQTAAARLGADVALERERGAGPVNGPAAPPPGSTAIPTTAAPPSPMPTPTATTTPPPTAKPQGSTP